MNSVDPACGIKQEPCGKGLCALAVEDCVIIMTYTGLNEGCMRLCSCGISKF